MLCPTKSGIVITNKKWGMICQRRNLLGIHKLKLLESCCRPVEGGGDRLIIAKCKTAAVLESFEGLF